MTAISKLFGSEIGKTDKNLHTLWCICTFSSSASTLLLLKLYKNSLEARKSTKRALELQQQQRSKEKRGSGEKNKKLFSQILRIFRILVPKWNSPEIGFMTVISGSLVIRSLCDLWTIYLGTLMESAIIAGKRGNFLYHLGKFAMTMPVLSLTNSVLKYATRQLEIRFRKRLTHYLMKRYMYKLTFYKLNQKMRNVDQLVTTDVEKFAKTAASLYGQVSKPLLDIVIYVYGISRSIGASVPSIMMGYLSISAVIIAFLRRPMARLTSAEQALEGEYRFANSRIITNSEEISFYKGGSRELDWLLNSFSNLYNHLDGFISFKFITEFFENFVAKYFATVVGYYAVGRPFFGVENRQREFSEAEYKERQETYYGSARMLLRLSTAIGRLVLNGKNLSQLAGYTTRVDELLGTLKQLNAEEETRMQKKDEENRGHYVIKDNIIRFHQVPIVTPNGDVLIEKLSFEVKSGTNVLVSGPNGSGKSSLFRILGELWPLQGGTVTKPETSKLFYVPQRPYMPFGTFRDQIIYPDSVEQMKAKGLNDSDLVQFLKLADLDWMIEEDKDQSNGTGNSCFENFEKVWKESAEPEQEKEEIKSLFGQKRSWDTVANWMDVLSGGQKQRLAMSRMFYHKPQFAILDECTSAVSVDVEGSIYKYCKTAGITLFTVTHRKSLWAYHDFVLHMDGRGSYSMKEIDHEEDPEFGS